MKSTFNKKIKQLTRIDEIELFRLLADLFNTQYSKGTFVKETHGYKGFVDYKSNILNRISKKIADFPHFCYNKKRINTNMFLQTKYHNKKYKNLLILKAIRESRNF